ncbi:VWA domain-containing protein [Acidipila sp. EB88]|uniref:VWA domain-containing protein n=1 Tax=Acidipila sp. EB88 TaxID=2305226 RepID=UPI000F5DC40C|nr:VWA domain-containing protein [Acidipila sp. EB88]RRA49358.1 VWA domain-containing protein [Acidipila sp. EB88]
MLDRYGLLLTGGLALLTWVVPTQAQNQAQGNDAVALQPPPFTLQASVRRVVEDVLVTDAKGKPILGLPQSAFHVQDDGKPQVIRNFEASAESVTDANETRSTPGVFSNVAMLQGDRNINVLLIDNMGVDVADQMYFRLQVLHSLAGLPSGTPIAVFRTTGHGPAVLMQSVTTDRELIRRAIENSAPALTSPIPSSYSVAVRELSELGLYLRQYKGRKSLLWFAAAFPLRDEQSGAAGAGRSMQSDEAEMMVLRALEGARVAVYPVDVRGVLNVAGPLNQAKNTSEVGGSPVITGSNDAAAQRGSWNAMDEIAAATGGHAYYSNNALGTVLQQAVSDGRHAYAVTYDPTPYSSDGRFHKVRVTVDGPYQVSYRQGYYAKDPAGLDEEASVSGMESDQVPDGGPASPLPIVFLARIKMGAEAAQQVAGAPAKNAGEPLVIDYGIAAKDLVFNRDESGRNDAHFKVAALAYNAEGEVLSSAMDEVTTHYDDAQMEQASTKGVPTLQQLRVAHGAKYLMLSVIDLESGRTGTVQLSVASAEQGSKASE